MAAVQVFGSKDGCSLQLRDLEASVYESNEQGSPFHEPAGEVHGWKGEFLQDSCVVVGCLFYFILFINLFWTVLECVWTRHGKTV